MKRLALLAGLALLALVGCGDDDDEGGAGREPAKIVVESPEPAETVSTPVTVSGTASVFEGTVQIRIRDAGGDVIARAFATASAGAPERGEFTTQVGFVVDRPQDGVIEAFEQSVASPEESPERELFKVAVPVELEP